MLVGTCLVLISSLAALSSMIPTLLIFTYSSHGASLQVTDRFTVLW